MNNEKFQFEINKIWRKRLFLIVIAFSFAYIITLNLVEYVAIYYLIIGITFISIFFLLTLKFEMKQVLNHEHLSSLKFKGTSSIQIGTLRKNFKQCKKLLKRGYFAKIKFLNDTIVDFIQLNQKILNFIDEKYERKTFMGKTFKNMKIPINDAGFDILYQTYIENEDEFSE